MPHWGSAADQSLKRRRRSGPIPIEYSGPVVIAEIESPTAQRRSDYSIQVEEKAPHGNKSHPHGESHSDSEERKR